MDETLLKDELEDKERDSLERYIHGSWVVSTCRNIFQWKPRLPVSELQSTTADVISVRARPVGERVKLGTRSLMSMNPIIKGFLKLMQTVDP